MESPFDYEHHGLIYSRCTSPTALRWIRTRHACRARRTHNAAGGRTLALFTSWRAMEATAEALRPKLPFKVLTQRDLPKQALIAAFMADESACLFATAGFFQGVDIPGRTLSLVTIDRIPFPRPDDPLLAARREQLGADSFRLIDLPRAAMLLAQAAGRLIRSTTDRGVVAVLDPRLGTAGYRWDIVLNTRRCAAHVIAPTPRRSCARSPPADHAPTLDLRDAANPTRLSARRRPHHRSSPRGGHEVSASDHGTCRGAGLNREPGGWRVTGGERGRAGGYGEFVTRTLFHGGDLFDGTGADPAPADVVVEGEQDRRRRRAGHPRR